MQPTVERFPFVTWERLSGAITWKQGQHVLSVGGTGSGKTTLEGLMLRRMTYVAVLVSKGKDDTLDGPLFRNYVRYDTWPPKTKDHKVMLWPANGRNIPETRENKKQVFARCMDSVLLHEGGWCLGIDELHYMCDSLKLEAYVTDLEEQGRSAGISIWGNTQRPSGIPLACYANASHGFFFLTQEEYDVKRLGSINNRHTNAREMMTNIQRLGPHEFVYIDRSGKIPPVRSIADVRKTVTPEVSGSYKEPEQKNRLTSLRKVV